jgi:uncharacterized membrane protein
LLGHTALLKKELNFQYQTTLMDRLQHELKKEFQLERMILFSDAVFAIAITLLVLELKSPEASEAKNDEALAHHLLRLIPKFSGFLISFFLIGLYWTVHHRIFAYVINYNRRLIWLNLFFLFFIVLMPFTTSIYGNFSVAMFRPGADLKIPLLLYALNVTLVGVLNCFLWLYISNPKHQLSFVDRKDPEVNVFMKRSLVVPLAFLTMIPVAYLVDVRLAVYVPMFIPLFMRLLIRKPKVMAPIQNEPTTDPSTLNQPS